MAATPQQIAQLCAEFIRSRHGNLPMSLTVTVSFGPGLEFEGIEVKLVGHGAAADQGPTEMETNVIDALSAATGPLTGPQLAARAGYSMSGRFRATLAKMVRDGLVENCHPGYRLPPQARA
jgi:hypothetical protein